MPEKPLLTEILAQDHPSPEETLETFQEYITKGMFIQADAVSQNFVKIPFSRAQLESLSVMLSAGIENYQKIPKLVLEYERLKSYVVAIIRQEGSAATKQFGRSDLEKAGEK